MKLEQNTLFHNRYRLIRLLGRGGFSEVWLAEDQRTRLFVAVKIYAPGTGLDESGIELFSSEFALVFNLNHSNLLRPSYYDCWERQPYLVLPYCERGSTLKLVGNISEKEAWHFIHDVAAGLEYLHAKEPPIIHQDIKPDNVLMAISGTFMITDFGISTKIRSTLRKSIPHTENSGGTTAYMGPERFSKQPAPVKASDIWSLGATLYELLTGDVPFGNMGGVLQKNGAEIPVINGNYSNKLKLIVETCLAKEPWERPTACKLREEAGIMLRKMENLNSSNIPFQESKQQNPEKQEKKVVAILIGLLLIVGGVVAYLYVSTLLGALLFGGGIGMCFTRKSKKAKEKEQKNSAKVGKQPVVLSIWLVLILLIDIIVICALVFHSLYDFYPSPIVAIGLSIAVLLNVYCVILLWKGWKIAFWGCIISSIVICLLSLLQENKAPVIHNLIGVVGLCLFMWLSQKKTCYWDHLSEGWGFLQNRGLGFVFLVLSVIYVVCKGLYII